MLMIHILQDSKRKPDIAHSQDQSVTASAAVTVRLLLSTSLVLVDLVSCWCYQCYCYLVLNCYCVSVTVGPVRPQSGCECQRDKNNNRVHVSFFLLLCQILCLCAYITCVDVLLIQLHHDKKLAKFKHLPERRFAGHTFCMRHFVDFTDRSFPFQQPIAAITAADHLAMI